MDNMKRLRMGFNYYRVGRTNTDSHKRPCWVYEDTSRYILLTTATTPGEGFFYHFRKQHFRRAHQQLPKGRNLTFAQISKVLLRVEHLPLRGYKRERRADYFVQLMKVLGVARFRGIIGRHRRVSMLSMQARTIIATGYSRLSVSLFLE